MFELPLFPLNTVLFPGMPLQLHIFEERYKRMIKGCLDNRRPFGVVLIRHGREALGPLAEPHAIGCSARIVEVEPLSEGQMNIVALGQERFRIVSLDYGQPYLVGKVEPYPIEALDAHALAEKGRRLLPWVRRYMEILTEASDVNLEPEHLPTDPLVLAYLAAVLLQIPPAEKQDLLAAAQASDLLGTISELYRREVALLRTMLSAGDRENSGRLSLN
jgi:Lon protease-like protein